jgi:hypothetical protein
MFILDTLPIDSLAVNTISWSYLHKYSSSIYNGRGSFDWREQDH